MMNVTRSGIVQAVADRVRDAPDRDEVARAQQRDGIGIVDALAVERLLEDLARPAASAR